MKKQFSILLLMLILSVGVFTPVTASAADEDDSCSNASSGFLGLPTWYKYLDYTDNYNECTVNAITYEDSDDIHLGLTIGAVLLAVTEILLWVAGVVAVGAVIYGGISYTISQGAPDKTAAAKNIIMNGLTGMVIAALAVVIVGLVSGIVTGSGGSGSTNPQQQSYNERLMS